MPGSTSLFLNNSSSIPLLSDDVVIISPPATPPVSRAAQPPPQYSSQPNFFLNETKEGDAELKSEKLIRLIATRIENVSNEKIKNLLKTTFINDINNLPQLKTLVNEQKCKL